MSTLRRYERAAFVQSGRLDALTTGLVTDARWADDATLVVRVDGPGGGRFLRIDAASGTVTPVALDDAPTAGPPNLDRPWPPGVDIYSPMGPSAVPSPDGALEVVRRGSNIAVRRAGTRAETRLTTDGRPRHAYANTELTAYGAAISLRRAGITPPPAVAWSPDSTRVLTYRVDARRVRNLTLVEAAPGPRPGAASPPRPRTWSYATALPGDPDAPMIEYLVIDVRDARRTDLAVPAHPAFYVPLHSRFAWWSADGRTVFVLVPSRPPRELSLWAVDAATGVARRVVTESAATWVNPVPGDIQQVIEDVPGRPEVLWFSERDDRGHLYRYDTSTGALLNRVTGGEINVRRIDRIDAARGWVYVTASSAAAGDDPYLARLYRARLDGGAQELLTPEPADHEASVSPGGSFLLDTWSTVDRPPVAVLRRADGTVVVEVARADASARVAWGWRAPRRFSAPGADGTTEIRGTLFLPSAGVPAEPGRPLPVIDYVYGGPQLRWAPTSFGGFVARKAQALAELGFAVVTIDGRGTPGRGKAFQEASFGAGFATAGGLLDHVAAIRRLAADTGLLDVGRVGIHGHSAGGYASARAMFDHPGFYRVAVASSGSHDQRLVGAGWGEAYMGLPSEHPEAWRLQSNASVAHRLAGRLLLIHGELDDDTPAAGTLRVADALVAANRPFDLLIMPGMNHALSTSGYYFRRLWDYLVEHLAGLEPPADFEVRLEP